MAAVGTLEDEARKRKDRLRALNRKSRTENKGEITEEKKDPEPTEVGKLPRPVFRSYRPQDKDLQESTLPRIKPGDAAEEVKVQLEAGKSEHIVNEVDLTTLAPRKPDWDLKRDVAKNIEKLERRTQKAIAELIRERLKENQSDLATAVNASEAIARVQVQDDDD